MERETYIHHCDWTLLKKFSRSEIKGQGNDQTEYYVAEACISTVWRRGSAVYCIIALYCMLATVCELNVIQSTCNS